MAGTRTASACALVAQSLESATPSYIAGSAITIPSVGLLAGSNFRWRFNISKTAAGLAPSSISVVAGTAGTVADAILATFTKPAGTAVADEGAIEILLTVRTSGVSGIAVGEFCMMHNLASTGHMTIPCATQNVISSAFNMTAVAKIGLVITTGAGDLCTIQMAQSEGWNL